MHWIVLKVHDILWDAIPNPQDFVSPKLLSVFSRLFHSIKSIESLRAVSFVFFFFWWTHIHVLFSPHKLFSPVYGKIFSKPKENKDFESL